MAGTSGLDLWKHLSVALDMVGTINPREHMLLPSDYENVLGGGKLSLTGLSEPFYRTKLLLERAQATARGSRHRIHIQ